MKRMEGVVTATVKSLNDPDGMGRVQVIFPWMSQAEPVSNWARIAAPMAGGDRGVQFMPESGDEVLIAFEHGELRSPYVVGFLWNGKEAPPRAEPEQRVIRTKSGHLLEFDDTENNEKITLAFKGGAPSITLDATGIEIKFSESSLIRLTAAELTIKNDTLVNINP